MATTRLLYVRYISLFRRIVLKTIVSFSVNDLKSHFKRPSLRQTDLLIVDGIYTGSIKMGGGVQFFLNDIASTKQQMF